jgi:hypothetical protein
MKLDYSPALMTGFFVFLAIFGAEWLPTPMFALLCAGAVISIMVGLMKVAEFMKNSTPQ